MLVRALAISLRQAIMVLPCFVFEAEFSNQTGRDMLRKCKARFPRRAIS
jgi:hypothetical protein